ncbi:WXG100 family type VII secretion target [Nocardia sp. NPDC088792]|uniref:WXG100 family type VII secretion target n=1 Tax=Nocardia sp. NPDC088792 TaxID=3364332 RepID=UPI0038249060
MGDKVDNPWIGLSRQAHSGHLHLDEGSAKEAANFAAECVNALVAAKGHTDKLCDKTGFSGPLQSALNLADRFALQGKQVSPIIDSYIDLLNTMGDTFVTAGKLYQAQDGDSKAAFDRFKTDAAKSSPVPDFPADLKTDIPYVSDQSKSTLSDSGDLGDLNTVAARNSSCDTTPIPVEDPNSHDGDWFLAIRQGMNPSAIAARSTAWKWIADEITTNFQQLSGRVERLQANDNWTGEGIDQAIGAAKRFEGQATDFATDLHAIAENMLHTAGWMNQTMAGMPTEWQPKLSGTAEGNGLVATARTAFKTWYIPNIQPAGTTIPTLVNPTDPTKPVTYSNNGNNNGNNNGGNSNGGNSNGGNSNGGNGGGGTGGGGAVPRSAVNAGLPTAKDGSTANPDKAPGTQDKTGPTGGNQGKGTQNGTDPNGGNQSGTNPSGTNQNSTNPSASTSSSPDSGMSQLQSALQSGMQALQSTTQQSPQQNLANQLQNSPLAAIPSMLDDLAKEKLPGGLGGPGGGPGVAPAKVEPMQSKLFPRAAIATEATESVSGVASAGVAAGSATPMGGGMGGGGMGHGGGHGGGQGKEHKRMEALESSEYLDAAMGTAPIVAKPVVEG